MKEQKILSVRDLAKRWGCTEKTVRMKLRSGALRGFKLGNKDAPWRVRIEIVEEFECRETAEIEEEA
jgi:hypothetical protein